MASKKENYICLDTCSLIYLANGTEPAKFLDDIIELMNNGTLTILLPEFVVHEWKKNNQEGTIHGQIRHSINEIEKAINPLKEIIDKVYYQDRFEKLFNGEDTTLKDGLEELKYKLNANYDLIRQKVDKNIHTIENIMARAVIISHNDDILLKAGKMALKKSAPVHKQNGYADAVIVLTFLDYVKKHNLPNAAFVTYNSKDFCEGGSKELHSDLKPLFAESNATFHTLLAQPLNAIDKNLVSDDLLELIEQERDDIVYCTECERGEGFPNEIHFYEPESILNEKEVLSDDGPELPLGLDLPPKRIVDAPSTFQRGVCSYCSSEYIKCSCGEVFFIDSYAPDDEHQCTSCGLTYKRSIEIDRKGVVMSEDWMILDDEKIKCCNCGKRFLDHYATGLCDECSALDD